MHVAEPPSGFVTVTERGPTAAAVPTVTLAVSFVAEFLVTLLIVTSGPNCTDPPAVANVAANPEPLMLTFAVWPRRAATGVTDVAVGTALTENLPSPSPTRRPG